MSSCIRVDPDQLRSAAVHIDGQGEDLLVGYSSVHSRIEAAQSGWAGRSAAALSARLAEWQATVAGIHARVSDHGTAMHGSGGFATTERNNTQAIAGVGRQDAGARPVDL